MWEQTTSNIFSRKIHITHFVDTLQVASLFPSYVEEEDIEKLQADVTMEEIKVVLANFKKDKIPDVDGWAVDDFSSLFDILGPNLLKVVN